MRRHLCQFISALWLLSNAFTLKAGAEILVREVKPDKGYVVLKVAPEDGVTQGATLEGQVGANPCRLKVYYVNGAQAAATTKGCPDASQLEPNHPFALGAARSPGPPSASTSAPSSGRSPRASRHAAEGNSSNDVSYHHFGVHLYYSLASSVDQKFTATGTSEGTAISLASDNSYTGSSAPGFGLRYTFIKRRKKPTGDFNLGGMAAFSYDLGRKLTSSKDNSTGISTALTDLKLGVSVLEVNFVGEVSKIYFFLGLNYALISVSGADATLDFQTVGTYGTQLGTGVRLGPVGLELLYRTVNAKITSLVEGVEAETVNSRLWGFMLRAAISFP